MRWYKALVYYNWNRRLCRVREGGRSIFPNKLEFAEDEEKGYLMYKEETNHSSHDDAILL